jgi:diaminohydroxyphosphoribosylaminopyrimidine deaminase / 5-amino-6-(5-phosphoribosylamino)uracil reductase
VNGREAVLRACALARRATGDVEPNPIVGCVLLKDERVLAEGWHRAFGGPHAEVDALTRAGHAAAGATACVTLEPCSSHGKTPPCTDALLAAGVKHVVVGCVDPDPRHQGKGLQRLLAAGVTVDLLDLPEASALLERFRAGLASRRPHVLAKWAMSRDGGIAPRGGERLQISGPHSQALVHRWRAHLDAIVVGVNTVVTDDPLLTARGPHKPVRALRRVVLDPSLRMPPVCRLVATVHEAPVWVLCAEDAEERREEALRAEGVFVFRVPRGQGDAHDPTWLRGAFELLRAQGCQRVMVEGGAHTLTSCLAADVIDQVAVFIAPMELGPGALRPLTGLPAAVSPHEVARALQLQDCRVSRVGADTLLRGFRI